MHDYHNINLVQDDIAFEVNRIVEFIKYVGIEKDTQSCRKCPKDFLHHQAYNFVHHAFSKFCKNEKHKHDYALTKKDFEFNDEDKHKSETLSCHILKKTFNRIENKINHIKTQHFEDNTKSIKCGKCD